MRVWRGRGGHSDGNAKDDDVLGQLGGERKFERDVAAEVGNIQAQHRVDREDRARARG